MSINEIRLDPSQLTDLYGLQLIGTDSQPTPRSEPITPPMLGEFGKKVLILVNEPEHAYLSDEGMKLLTGILAACGMSMADVGILNLTTELNLSTPTLQDLFNPSAWWIFGIDAERLQLGIMSNSEQTNSYKNVPVFWSPALKTLEGDPAAKRTLWGQLKKHYGV